MSWGDKIGRRGGGASLTANRSAGIARALLHLIGLAHGRQRALLCWGENVVSRCSLAQEEPNPANPKLFAELDGPLVA